MWREDGPRADRSLKSISEVCLCECVRVLMEVYERASRHSFDCLLLLHRLTFFFLFFFSLCVSTHEFGLGILRTHSLLSLSGSFWWLKNPSRSRIVGNVGLMGGMAAAARRRRGSKEEKMKKPNGYVYRRLRRYFSLFFPSDVVKRDFPKAALLKNKNMSPSFHTPPPYW